jgi:hypothetical protein
MGFRVENSIVSRETLWPKQSLSRRDPWFHSYSRKVVLCFAQLFPETPLSERELV